MYKGELFVDFTFWIVLRLFFIKFHPETAFWVAFNALTDKQKDRQKNDVSSGTSSLINNKLFRSTGVRSSVFLYLVAGLGFLSFYIFVFPKHTLNR